MSFWQTYYHLVWSTRRRSPLITDAVTPQLYSYIRGKANALECPLHAVGGIADHIHLVISIPPKLSIANTVGHLKGSSSHHINQTFADQNFAWQREYGVFSLGRKQLPRAIAYVENQKQHHAARMVIRGLEPPIAE